MFDRSFCFKRIDKMTQCIKILAVADPAVFAFDDEKLDIFSAFSHKVVFEMHPWSEYTKFLQLSLSGSGGYDIVMFPGHLFLKDLVDNKQLSPLDFNANKLRRGLAYDIKMHDRLYAFPAFYDGHIIVFKKGVSARLDAYDNKIIEPDTFIKLATEDFKGAFSVKAAASEIFTDALPFLRYTHNGTIQDIYTQDGLIEKADAFTQRLAAYCSLKDSALPGTDKFGNEEVASALIKDEAQLIITWSGQLGLIDRQMPLDEGYGFATLSTAWNVAWNFGLLESSCNKEICHELFDYLCCSDIDKKCALYSGTPLYKDTVFDRPWSKALDLLLEHAKPLPFADSSPAKNGLLYEYIYKAYTGQMDATQALSEAFLKIGAMERS